MEDITQPANQKAREQFALWQNELQENIYTSDPDLIHSIQYFFPKDFSRLNAELEKFGARVAKELDPLVAENNLAKNLPTIEPCNFMGENLEKIIHHPTYTEAGDIIYGSGLMKKMSKPGGLLEALSLFLLSSEAGEAGHNCPIACSAGILRVFSKVADFPQKKFYFEKLIAPSFRENFTGAQFLTEIQGGSDVGANAVYAEKTSNEQWKIFGEKWFCSNANAELFFITARFDKNNSGTKGLGLFLIPATLENGSRNNFHIRRLKEKLGTRSMATGEIEFHGAIAYPMGEPQDGFKLVMENVLHISRVFNSFCVLGMARRAFFIAKSYAKYRLAFGEPILNYPLVKENLAKIKAENTAFLASIFATTRLQDDFDRGQISGDETKLILRLLVNLNKYLSAAGSVEHVHHALDVLAGNGTIETFSSIPRLLRDCVICENWEGTHNVLRLQILRDLHKFQLDAIFLRYLQNELKKIDGKNAHVDLLTQELKKLENEFQHFRALSAELQSLKIREVVDHMAFLYSALMLLQEALDQQKTQKSNSKLNCLEYFCALHFKQESLQINSAYFDLIAKIIL